VRWDSFCDGENWNVMSILGFGAVGCSFLLWGEFKKLVGGTPTSGRWGTQ
jgi:hypothetical protein